MGRLIDADAEIQKIFKEIERYEAKMERLESLKSKEPHNRYHDWDSEIKQAKDVILLCKQDIAMLQGCPTAYSVEKVVEGLENEIARNPYMSVDVNVGYGAGMRQAIKIVRGGGVDE